MGTLIFDSLNRFYAVSANCPIGGGKFGTCDTGLPGAHATAQNLQTLLQLVFAIAGGVAVVMIAVGGLRFITAQGEPASVAQARKILVYALIGLVFSLFAEVIVSFVIGKL